MVSVTFNSDQWQTVFCNWDRWYVKQLRIQPNAAWDRAHTQLPGTCFCRHFWASCVWSHVIPFPSQLGQRVVPLHAISVTSGSACGPLHAVSITTRSACGPPSWASCVWSHVILFPAQLGQRVVPLHVISVTSGSACGPISCHLRQKWVSMWSTVHFMLFPSQLGQHVVPLHAVSDTTGSACGPTSCRFRHNWVSMWSHFMPFPAQLGQRWVREVQT